MNPWTKRGLKEWAVVIQALKEGRQVLLLRKGGIHEPRGEFRAAHEEFFLFPGFEHQKPELLKPEAVERYRALLEPSLENGPLRIDTFARLAAQVRLDDPTKARSLSRHHIWSEAYVEMRSAYKPENPLHVLLLRAHAMPRMIELPRLPRYAGCRSWLEFEEELSAEGARPVLDDETFSERVREVERLLQTRGRPAS